MFQDIVETNVKECDPTAKDEIQKIHDDVLSLISSKDFQNSKKAFDSQLQSQEQENKKMKIIGGIKGIANNQQALNEFFLTAGNIGAIVEEFENIFQIRGNISGTKNRHYQLTGSKNKSISENVNTLTEMMNFNISFNNSSNVYNIFTYLQRK